MKAKKIGSKSIEVLKAENPRTIVLEGAVRSGKTVVSLIKFYSHVLDSNENVFLMAGATMGSVSRNCITGDFGIIAISGGKFKQRVDQDGNHYLELQGTEKKVYYVGADNEKSYRKIQGLSIAGFYADEVTNMAKSFFFMALTRSVASQNPLDIITLNPENPSHWFYSDYLNRLDEEQPAGYYYFHFLLHDNSALSEQRISEISKQFTGVFYQKYILGLRVRAEGACYPSFSKANIIDFFDEKKIKYIQIGVDIGGNKSATVFTATGFYFENNTMNMIVLDEMYDTKNKNTETLIESFKSFVNRMKEKYITSDCYVDSAEQLIMKSLRNTGVINVHNSLKKRIIDRIRITDLLLSKKRLYILSHCKNIISAFEAACWNDKSIEPQRLDDGTTNIDSLDSFEYSFENKIGELSYDNA